MAEITPHSMAVNRPPHSMAVNTPPLAPLIDRSCKMVLTRMGSYNKWILTALAVSIVTGSVLASRTEAADSFDCFLEAERNGRQAQQAFQKCMNFTHGWLAHRDPKSGLIPRNLTSSPYWNAQDSAADNYPFMTLTAALLDREMFDGTMLNMLETEIRLTNRLDNLPDDFDFATQKFRLPGIEMRRLIFGGSEYVKDGLIPLTEWLGYSPWAGRMMGIQDSIWKHAPFDTKYGKIPSNDFEINGEQLQVLCRLYWMTGDERYREWAFRIADYYLLDHLPTDGERLSLDDHGCEIIGGLAGGYFLAAHTDPARREKYREPIHRLLDRILEIAINQDGLFHMVVNPISGEVTRSELTDNWGYDYNAVLNVAQLDNDPIYYAAVRNALENIHKYVLYPWEGGGSDGYSDAIEGGINLLNRIPVESGFEWVDDSMDILLAKQRADGVIEGWHGDGNFARTALMYALLKTQGVHVNHWRADLSFGAVREGNALYLSISGDWDWSGVAKFDLPRHREYFNLPADYPRINQFPEWFTVDPKTSYRVSVDGAKAVAKTGEELHKGFPVRVQRGTPLHITVRPAR